MIITRTPYRISFFGGGTDFPEWYFRHGGAVLAATIDKYCRISARYLPPFFEHRIRVVYSKVELCRTVDDIVHPAVREVLRFLRIERGVEIHHDGDLPARSGMGSSSAFTVGLLHALHGLQGRIVSKQQLSREGIHVEQDLLREKVGCQDQVLCAHGGLSRVDFEPTGAIRVQPLSLSPARIAELESHLMLFFTGISRTSSEVVSSYANGSADREAGLRFVRDLVDRSLDLLASDRSLNGFGDLLHQAWTAKRQWSSQVSNGTIDDIYRTACGAGAVGGKLLGAGGGGFMLLFVPPRKQADVRRALGRLVHVPFEFESAGSQIVFFDPEKDYGEDDRIAEPEPAAEGAAATVLRESS
jgi:D-glycero-alpha-D-manno-heptose-7-phosphate kinase